MLKPDVQTRDELHFITPLTGGSRQLTYNGHPLYTYIGDTAPGQARGINLNLNGGLWHEVPASR